MKRLIPALVVLLLAGCGGGSSEPSPRCHAAPAGLLDRIASGAYREIRDTLTLEDGQYVRSADYNQVFIVAARIEGSGRADLDGEIGVWATNKLSHGLLMSVDANAFGVTQFPESRDTDAGITVVSDGVEDAESCV